MTQFTGLEIKGARGFAAVAGFVASILLEGSAVYYISQDIIITYALVVILNIFVVGFIASYYNDQFKKMTVEKGKLRQEVYALEVAKKTLQFRSDALVKEINEPTVGRNEELKNLHKSISSVLFSEVQIPLEGIKIMASAMSSGNLSPHKHREFSRLIHSASTNTSHVTSNLLDIARLEDGSFSINRSQVHVRIFLKSLSKFFEKMSKNKTISLKTIIADKVPETVWMDNSRMTQALSHVVSSAFKHTPTGGAVTVSAMLHEKGNSFASDAEKSGVTWLGDEENISNISNSLLLMVSCGVEATNKSGIYTTSSKSSDSGIGLTIAKGIVEAHGGTIGLTSKGFFGSTFYITIPIN